MTLFEFIDKALEVPFKPRGRDYSGWDCFGSVFCFYRDVLKIELSENINYGTAKDYKEIKGLIDSEKNSWIKVDKYEVGDICFYHVPRRVCHIGLIVGKNKVLHAEEKVGTFIEKLDGIMWGKKLEGVYRLNE